MIKSDEGFLLSKFKYNENSIIADFYTKTNGKISGIIFGGTSKKIKNYLQIGNNFHVNFNSKSDNRIGYFKVEIEQALSPYYFDDQHKLLCITSAMHLVRLLNAEFQKNESIFKLIENFYDILKSKNWIKDYIFWELNLFKILGFDLDLKSLVDEKIIGNEKKYISKSLTEKKIIPNFLIEYKNNSEELVNLLDGLKLVGDYLEKTILKPNNLTQPVSRLNFINALK